MTQEPSNCPQAWMLFLKLITEEQNNVSPIITYFSSKLLTSATVYNAKKEFPV